MKIAHITTVHDFRDSRIFSKYCCSLASADHEVFLLAVGPDDHRRENVQIYGIARSRGPRLWRALIHVIRATTIASKLDVDIYHFHDPELIAAGLYLRMRGHKVIYDVHEDLPEDIRLKDWIPGFLRSALSKIALLIENFTARRLSAITTSTPYIRDRFAKLNPNTIDIRNYPIRENFVEAQPVPSKENAVCYVGNISRQRGIIEMLDIVQQTHAEFYLAGKFWSEELFAEARNHPAWERTHYLGWLSPSEVRQTICRCRVGLVLLHPTATFLTSLPIKMFEYMAAGLPVLASDFPLWKSIISDADCGEVIDPFDAVKGGDILNGLLDRPELAAAMGDRGRRAALSKYSWDQEFNKVVGLYEGLL